MSSFKPLVTLRKRGNEVTGVADGVEAYETGPLSSPRAKCAPLILGTQAAWTVTRYGGERN